MMSKVLRDKRGTAMQRYLPALAVGILAAALMVPEAQAQTQAVPGALGANYSQNANKPINISSETLEVDDKKKVAIFRGAVSATQGDFNMKSRELVVYYTAGSGGNKRVAAAGQPAGGVDPVAAPAASPLPGGGNGEITKIDAIGDVILTTKDSQECRGERATYKVQEQLVVIEGNVRVAKGPENVIRGEKMVVNLKDSTTKFDNIGGETSNRISVILQPREKDKDKAKKPEAAKENSE